MPSTWAGLEPGPCGRGFEPGELGLQNRPDGGTLPGIGLEEHRAPHPGRRGTVALPGRAR